MRACVLTVMLSLMLAMPALGKARLNPRVARAISNQRPTLVRLFRKAGASYPARRVFIRVFKKERVLELWALAADGTYRKVIDYPICAASGTLGPKRRQGDLQVPEGFYHVSVFNPWSAYHLSLGINYPNQSDRILGHRSNLGGAIMIHGNCVSIGCVAITNDPASAVYLAAVEAWRSGRRRIPVHIFPTRLDARGMAWLRLHHDNKLVSFWDNLRPGFEHFERHRTLPRIRVDRKGRYRISAPPAVQAQAPAGAAL